MIGFWTSLASSILTLVGVIITVVETSKSTRNEVSHKLETAQAVTDTKIENLTFEVHRHNDYAERIPTAEQKIADIENRVIRLEDKN